VAGAIVDGTCDDRAPGQEISLSAQLFAFCFLAGAAVVAVWVDVRFSGLAPETLRAATLHMGATIVAAQILVPVATHSLTGSKTLALVAAFGVGFPALVYSILAAIWLVRLAHAGLRGRFR
jgi:hypothetical protein